MRGRAKRVPAFFVKIQKKLESLVEPAIGWILGPLADYTDYTNKADFSNSISASSASSARN